MLYIVSTPIGNLKDITYRAVEILKSADIIAAEDTRHTKNLLRHYGIETPLTSYFEHNEQRKTRALVAQLKEGKNVALVSDAGTPGICDPGYRLIKAANDEGVAVTVIPGACAALAGLSLSGLPSDEFHFFGFLPVKPGQRRKKLESFRNYRGTIICYESPHRILKSLQDIKEVLNNPVVCIARELTKMFEETLRAPACELLAQLEQTPLKGEVVILLPAEEGRGKSCG